MKEMSPHQLPLCLCPIISPTVKRHNDIKGGEGQHALINHLKKRKIWKFQFHAASAKIPASLQWLNIVVLKHFCNQAHVLGWQSVRDLIALLLGMGDNFFLLTYSQSCSPGNLMGLGSTAEGSPCLQALTNACHPKKALPVLWCSPFLPLKAQLQCFPGLVGYDTSVGEALFHCWTRN